MFPICFFPDETPAANFLKEVLKEEDLVLICDKQNGQKYEETKIMLDINEHKYHIAMLEEAGPLRKDIEEMIKKFIPDNHDTDPPHLFYKQKYLASGKHINLYNQIGELDSVLGTNVIWELRMLDW